MDKSIGGFELIEKIGSGPTGEIYRAKQTSMAREVAVKLLSPRLFKDKAYKSEFIRMAKAAASLNHPNLVQVIDAGESDETCFIAMEYVQGPSLQTLIENQERIAAREAAAYAADAARALDAASKAGIVHQDVKPYNILITPDGTAKLSDLGLAKCPTVIPDLVGTPFYISPEQGQKQQADVRSDIYSLGAVLYHAVTGSPPYFAPSPAEIVKAHCSEELLAANVRHPAVPRALSDIIDRMLAKSPGERYQTPQEVVDDLGAYLAGRVKPAPRARKRHTTRPAPGTTARRRPVEQRITAKSYRTPLIVLGATAAVALIGFVIWASLPDPLAVEARDLLRQVDAITEDDEVALKAKKQLLLSVLSLKPEDRPALKPYRARAVAELAEIETTLARMELDKLVQGASVISDLNQIAELRRSLRNYIARLKPDALIPGAADELGKVAGDTIAELDRKEQAITEAERERTEREALAWEKSKAENAAREIREAARRGEFPDAIAFVNQLREVLKRPEPRRMLDGIEKEIRDLAEERRRSHLARAELALKDGLFDVAEEEYRQIKALGFDEFAASAEEGLAKVEAARKAQEDARLAGLKELYLQAVADARDRARAFDFEGAAAAVGAVVDRMEGGYKDDLKTRYAIYRRAADGFKALIETINVASPKTSISVISPGMYGVIDKADEKAYYVKSKGIAGREGLSMRHEWTGLKYEDLMKLADAVLRATHQRLDWACLAALLHQGDTVKAILEDAARRLPEDAARTADLLRKAGLLDAETPPPVAAESASPEAVRPEPRQPAPHVENAQPPGQDKLSPPAQRDLDELVRLLKDGDMFTVADKVAEMRRQYEGTKDGELLMKELGRIWQGR